MSLDILVVHSYEVVRSILKKYILAEFPHSDVDLLSSPDDAAKAVQMKKYDVVLCDKGMAEENDGCVCNALESTELNKDTPHITMVSGFDLNQDNHMLQQIDNQENTNTLTIPFTAFQLREMISRLCNQNKHRACPRYAIPQTTAIIIYNDHVLPVDVINISQNGMRCSFQYPQQPVDLMRVSSITLKFPDKLNSLTIADIKSCPVSLNIEAWNANSSPGKALMTLRFLDVTSTVTEILENAFKASQS